MDIKDFKAKFYPENKLCLERREIFNCLNSVYVVNEIPVDILFIGSSTTERFEVYPYFNKYGNIVKRGIGGEATFDLVKRLEYDAIMLKPKVCVVCEGLNNTASLWRAEHNGQKVTEEMVNEVLNGFKKDMEYVITTLKENGIIPVIGTVMPIGVKDCRNQVVLKENEILFELCAKHNVYLADYYSAVVSEDGITMKDYAFVDDLHPHVMGYNEIAKTLYPIFDKIFNK